MTETATKDYFLAYIASFPQVLQRHIIFNPELSYWSGYLESVSLEPSRYAKFAAELHFTLQTKRKLVQLRYLLGPSGKVQPVVDRDLGNMSEAHTFRAAVEEWVQEISHKERESALQQTALIKEELMATMWHPTRVAKLLEAGGFEALD